MNNIKTIEERALELYPVKQLQWGNYMEDMNGLARMSYIRGAEEQKNIDDANLHERFEKVLNGQKWDLIDEACKWLSDYFVFKHEAMSAQGCDAFLKEFRKAMEKRRPF